MIGIRFHVQMMDGSERDLLAGPVTQVAFEREHGKSLISVGDQPMVSDFYWLAWHAARAGDKSIGSFDEFLASVESVEMVGEENPGPLDDRV